MDIQLLNEVLGADEDLNSWTFVLQESESVHALLPARTVIGINQTFQIGSSQLEVVACLYDCARRAGFMSVLSPCEVCLIK